MSKSIIIWVSALVICFTVGMIRNALDPNFPISGTIGIDGKKVTYKFDKVFRSTGNYEFYIWSENKEIKGSYNFLSEKFNRFVYDSLKWKNGVLTGSIPAQEIGTIVHYQVVVGSGKTAVAIPGKVDLQVKFLGAVPATIKVLMFLTFFGGLLLSFRAAIEFFSDKPHIKRYTIYTTIGYLLYSCFTAPVQRTYELNPFGKFIPNIGQIFIPSDYVFIGFWLVAFTFIMIQKEPRKSILWFTFGNFLLTVFIF